MLKLFAGLVLAFVTVNAYAVGEKFEVRYAGNRIGAMFDSKFTAMPIMGFFIKFTSDDTALLFNDTRETSLQSELNVITISKTNNKKFLYLTGKGEFPESAITMLLTASLDKNGLIKNLSGRFIDNQVLQAYHYGEYSIKSSLNKATRK